jgi:hypothetical protein
MGDVTVVLGTCQRLRRPKQIQMFVTSLPETVTAGERVSAYLRSCQS